MAFILISHIVLVDRNIFSSFFVHLRTGRNDFMVAAFFYSI